MASWIWKFGEFEVYHNLLLHNRREQYGCLEPAVWKIYGVDPMACFEKTIDANGGEFHVRALGECSISIFDMDGKETKFFAKRTIPLPVGRCTVRIRVYNIHAFPALYVDGDLETDATWLVDDMSSTLRPVGTWEIMNDPNKTPDVFPFSYEPIAYVDKKPAGEGVLFDFGQETFADVRISGLTAEEVTVQLGESMEEAMDPEWSVIHFTEEPENGVITHIPAAFRYIYVSDANAEITARYEYLDIEHKGAFVCDNEVINRVWNLAAYTFHLNSREFFLDGIKRDRWVWSADAYQSIFVNHYLFGDAEIEKRTIIALGGKKPFVRHINTIMDYTFFWFISIYEYYKNFGDRKFLEQMLEQMIEVMGYCRGRVDADGFVRGRKEDWIFIDWAPMDKTGALCGEQILFAKALLCFSEICEALGVEDDGCGEQGRKLQQAVLEKFYDADKKVFIDSFESGLSNVTRQSNILAYLFLPVTEEQKQDIYDRVILNPEVRAITTPYFTFYENQVHCMQGAPERLENAILSYYGSMLETGATSLYEEYHPEMKGAEHYAMYGRPYEKSLCHAWSASPIYLLGAFRMGVKNTGIGYDSFEVAPQAGALTSFEGAVPVPGGKVYVRLDEKSVTVKSDIPGGVLKLNGQEWTLEAGKELTVAR